MLVMAGLSTAVRAYRYALLREFMRRHEYDALALTGADWFEWAANHELTDQAFERPFVLIVTASGNSFAVMSELTRNTVISCAQRGQSWVESYHYYAESNDAATHRWNTPQSYELVAEALRSAGLAQARIGVQAHGEWLARALDLLPATTTSNAGLALQALRWVKHAEEIATMRECAALTDWAIEIYRNELRPGCLLEQVDYLVASRLSVAAGQRLAGQNFVIKGIRTLCGAESACAAGDGVPSGRRLEANTVALTGLGTRLNGLAVELGRPWLVGKPDKRIIDLFDRSLSAQRAAIEAAVAGRPVSAIHAAAHEKFESAGLGPHLRLRAGHGIGVVQHDYPVHVPFDSRPLLSGEVYAIEPSVYISGVGGFRFADTVCVGAAAADCLTRATTDRAHLTLS
jgi:Xaa-Pro aminopeptidase